jgi:hypothetical protein
MSTQIKIYERDGNLVYSRDFGSLPTTRTLEYVIDDYRVTCLNFTRVNQDGEDESIQV